MWGRKASLGLGTSREDKGLICACQRTGGLSCPWLTGIWREESQKVFNSNITSTPSSTRRNPAIDWDCPSRERSKTSSGGLRQTDLQTQPKENNFKAMRRWETSSPRIRNGLQSEGVPGEGLCKLRPTAKRRARVPRPSGGRGAHSHELRVGTSPAPAEPKQSRASGIPVSTLAACAPHGPSYLHPVNRWAGNCLPSIIPRGRTISVQRYLSCRNSSRMALFSSVIPAKSGRHLLSAWKEKQGVAFISRKNPI